MPDDTFEAAAEDSPQDMRKPGWIVIVAIAGGLFVYLSAGR